jgi:RNA polymerase sigma-70 factor (ECF subfamily)
MERRFDDDGLVAQFRRGDEAAFAGIIQRYTADVAQLANRLLGWPGEVEDVVQEVFLSAYLNHKKFRGQCELKTWLFTITINQCRSVQRRQILRWRHLRQMQQDQAYVSHGNRSYKEDTVEAVNKAVSNMPRRYREVIVLRYLQELSIDEICHMLSISRNALNVRLTRARQKIAERLHDQGITNERGKTETVT